MRFSVIIPLFNKAPYVKKSLDSVLAQSFRDFELVVIDDGSSDESFSMAKTTLDGCDVPYQLIHQSNAGVSSARNKGVFISCGDYLCFLDADDWWAPTFLEKMDGLIREYPEASIYGTNYYYVKNGIDRVCIQGVQTGYMDYCRVYADSLRMPLTSISVSIPRQVFLEQNGFKEELKHGEDFDLWIRIALHNKVAFLSTPQAYYNQDSNPVWRGTKSMVSPQYHMLWNLDYLSEEERTNPVFKELLDKLRTYGLLPYYLSDKYRTAAKHELDKVDWNRQSVKTRILYAAPVPFIQCWMFVRKVGSKVKQRLMHRI